jgi:hypothetical protein
MPTYDGNSIFGYATKTRMEVNPSAAQINEFFGTTGMQSLFGGGRGRVFLIEGVLGADSTSDLNSAIALILSYDDGVGRVFEHPIWGAWPSVVFRRWIPGERFLFSGGNWYLPYKAQFDGLI